MDELPFSPLVLDPELVGGPHPKDDAVWLVHRPSTGDAFEVSGAVWRIASALDAVSTLDELVAETGLEAWAVQDAVRRLDGLGLLVDADRLQPGLPMPSPQWTRAPIPDDVRLEIHPDVRFECVGFGTCCERGYVIDVRDEQVDALRALAPEGRDPVMLWPRGHGQPWGHILDNDRGCVFLNEARHCTIHGTTAQPAACRVFPVVFALVDDVAVVSVSHRCGCGAGGGGPRLADQEEAVWTRLSAAPDAPRVPERVRLDDARTVSGPDAARALMRVAAQLPEDVDADWRLVEDAIAALRALPSEAEPVSTGLPDLPAANDPDPEVSGLSALRVALAHDASDADLSSALLGWEPREAPDVTARFLELAWDFGEGADGERYRFVRDHLFGLRPFQQATLTHGLLGLSVLLDSLHQGTPAPWSVRARIMAWDDLLPMDPVRLLLARAPAPQARDLDALHALLAAR